MAGRITFGIFADDNASRKFIQVAASVKLLKSAVSDLNQESLSLGKWTLAPTLVPALAAAASKTTALGTALGVAAGAGSVFGAAVLGQVKAMEKQQQTIDTTRKHLLTLTKGTTTYHQTLVKLNAEQKSFNQNFGKAAKGFDNLKASWQKFLVSTHGQSETAIGKTANLLADTLPRLVPIANDAGRAVNGLLTEFGKFEQGPGFARFLKILDTSGPRDITAFGKSIGHVFTGLGGILQHFVGPGNNAAQGLEHLTKAFSQWSNSQAGANAVNGFLKWSATNGPALRSVFGSLGKVLPPIAQALGQLGHTDLTIVAGGLKIIAGLPPQRIHQVADAIIALTLGLKALKIVGSVATIAKGVGAIGIAGAKGIAALPRAARNEGGFISGFKSIFGKAEKAAAGGGVLPGGVQKVFVVNMKGGLGGTGGVLGDLENAGGKGGKLAALAAVMPEFVAAAGGLAASLGLAVAAVKVSQHSGANPHVHTTNGIPTYNYSGMGKGNSVGAYANAVSDVDAKQKAAARSANALRAATMLLTSGHKAAAGAAKSFVGSLMGDVAGEKQAGTAAGGAARMVDQLTRADRGVPKSIHTSVSVGGLGASLTGVAQLQSALAALHSKSIAVRTFYLATHGHAGGGLVSGPGSGTSDSIPARLSNGEFVMRAAAVKRWGVSRLAAMNAEGYAKGGLVGKDKVEVTKAVQTILDELVKGIKRTNPLGLFVSKMQTAVSNADARLAALRGKRASVVGSAQGFKTSIFGVDYTQMQGGVSVANILQAQGEQRSQATALDRNIHKLIRMGMSKSLISQMMASGPQGIAEINALSTASRGQIHRLNALDKATTSSLHWAGVAAGDRLYGSEIHHARREDRLARAIVRALAHDHAKKGEVLEVHLHLEGKTIVQQVRAYKRRNGGKSTGIG